MDGVALLPPELTGAQEGTGGLFPAHHAAPLVVLHGQVTPRVQHMGEMVAEQGLAGGAHAQPLLQRVRAATGHPGHLGGEAFHQLALLLQQALGDQHGHGHVFMAGGLEPGIQILLDVFPDGVAVGAHHHKALHAGIIYQLCLQADVGVPLGKVHFLGGNGLNQLLFAFTHV